MSPVLAGSRTDRPFPSVQTSLAGCAVGGPFKVDGFPRYQNTVASLPVNGQRRLAQIVRAIVRSYGPGCRPIRTVQVYGHADWDTPRNFRREMQMSEQRAERVSDWLRTYVGPSIAARITWDSVGYAATQLAAPPTSELNRRRNRRVEVFLLKQVGFPHCSCPLPGHPHFNTWLQSSLRRVLKSPRVRVDGVFSPQTQAALRTFQARAGLAPTGRINRATYLKLLGTGQASAPCTSTSISGIDAAVQELKSKIDNCEAVEDGMVFWGLTCGSAVNRMVAELRSKGAFPGCKHRDRRVSARLYRAINNEGTGRCCIVEYQPDLPDTIKKLREALDDGFLIVASVLSGVCTGQGGSCSDPTCCDDPGPRKPFPDHWVLIIGHDSGNKFVFWDPNGSFVGGGHASNTTRFCNGFGFFFFDAAKVRFTTAADDTELAVDGAGDHTSPSRQGTTRVGVTCCPRYGIITSSPQHRYQVLTVVTV
jgi:hypothetical protein